MPLAQHLEDLRLRPAVDEDDEAEAELLLVDLVQVGELGEDGRVGVVPCSAAERAERCSRADRRVRAQRLDLLLLAGGVEHVLGALERVLELGEPLDEARVALEELGQLVGAQLPR